MVEKIKMIHPSNSDIIVLYPILSMYVDIVEAGYSLQTT